MYVISKAELFWVQRQAQSERPEGRCDSRVGGPRVPLRALDEPGNGLAS